MFDVFAIFILQCCVCFEELATLLEGAGYLFNRSSIKIYNLFNFNGEKCVVGEKNGCKSEVKCQGTDWYHKRGQKWCISGPKLCMLSQH